MVHSDPEGFDAFYKDARDRLLLQTYALTGDLPASRSAVRDSFVVAWHHWRKVSRLESPEAWVRPHAWSHAQRRHTARLWHRDKALGEEHRATLAALAKLSPTQRRLLVLTHLAQVSLPDMAREVSLPQEAAERELQLATAQFSLHREVPTTSIRPTVEALGTHVATGTRWPRPTILRRAGAARRRTHTSVGAVAAVAALLLGGSVVGASGEVAGRLGESAAAPGGSAAPQAGSTAVSAGPRGSSAAPRATPPTQEAPDLSPDDLLAVGQVRRLAPGRVWRAGASGDNTDGNGLVVPCQQEPFADPDGVAAAVRRHDAPARGPRPRVTATQLTELSADASSAGEAFRRALGWYAGCREPRTQLLGTYRLPAVGDDARVFVLRRWTRPTSTVSVAVARTGRFTTTLARTVHDGRPADLAPLASATAAAVNAFCGTPGAGACAAPPRTVGTDPLPAGEVPAILSVVDLPPVTGVRQPWVGTDPVEARVNAAATRCDEADFSDLRGDRTRTFVVPEADLPAAFGLTETLGAFPADRGARAFVERLRARVAGCPERDLGSDVEQLASRGRGDVDVAAWRITVEISDAESVRYLMAVVRRGRAVAQLGFVPAGTRTIATDDFLRLVDRAAERLGALDR
ncbi:hypothetical protein [Nocardioides perillae]|uniref:DNA-directed RNA polymerase specialized sigma24 family protein n=1 Tax=Nocardioides perillae TaxID=1119534 RepID=A0A7Y9RTK3_9ACTN|nr:hypothetical protein [Nocardioides perillae]NYG55084.1 DNA-directed RNA polymerase specialized sigma24 family protein [Nocardioides perillae]